MTDLLFAAVAQAFQQNRSPVRWIIGRLVLRRLLSEVGPWHAPIGTPNSLLGLPVKVDDDAVDGFGLVVR